MSAATEQQQSAKVNASDTASVKKDAGVSSGEDNDKKRISKAKKGGKPKPSIGDSRLRHSRRQSAGSQLFDACRMLRSWPAPCAKHITALNQFLERTVKENGVKLEELDRRSEFVRALETDADSKVLRLHIIGSARNGFAIHTDETAVLVELIGDGGGGSASGEGDTEQAKRSDSAKKVKRGKGGDRTKSETEKGDAAANIEEPAEKDSKSKRNSYKVELVRRKRDAFERIVHSATRRSCEVVERADEHVVVRERNGVTYRFRLAPLNNNSYVRCAVENAALLREYAALDSRCYAIGIVIAQLASTLHLDALDDAPRRGPPSPTTVRDQLATLTVYYLQKIKRSLPCLHELLGDKDKKNDGNKNSPSKSNASDVEANVAEQDEGKKGEGEKDKRKSGKDRRRQSGTRETRRRPEVPNVTEWQRSELVNLYANWSKEREVDVEKSAEHDSIAQLFLALVSFIALDFDPLATVVSITSSRSIVRRPVHRGWSSFDVAGYFFVEDVSRPTFNLCTELRADELWCALTHRLIAAFRYFATPVIRRSTEEKPTRLFDFVKVQSVLESRSANSNASGGDASRTTEVATEKKPVEGEDQAKNSDAPAKKDDDNKPDESKKNEPSSGRDGGLQKRHRDHTKRTIVRRTIVDSEEVGWFSAKLLNSLDEDGVVLVYEWSAEVILAHFPVVSLRPDIKPTAPAAAPAAAPTTINTGAEAVQRGATRRGCEICRREHDEPASECPVAKRCSLQRTQLRKVSRELNWHLSELMFTLHERCEPTDREIELKQTVIDDVFNILASTVHPNTRVDVFGSCANGFEYRGSDMDLCVTFGEIREAPSRGWQVNRLRKFADILQDTRGSPFRVLKLIETARVPIIKFRHLPTQVYGDVCLYNLLALENTAMMRTYSKIDSRVSVLGTMLKSMVKQFHINDASQRTLSSYAYLNMLVYFLQHCDPPVLPVLQELHDKKSSGKQPASTSAPQRMIDGKNAWFQQNMDYIRTHFQVGDNWKTYGDLWIEFLHYYAHKFNFKDYVISIRQSHLLKRSEKTWSHGGGICFAIEDPFETDHNLGDVLTPDTMARILDVFRAAYQLATDDVKFNEIFKEKKKDFREMRKYFFNIQVALPSGATNGKAARATNPNVRVASENDKQQERGRNSSARGDRDRRQRRRIKKERQGGSSKPRPSAQTTASATANGEAKREIEDGEDDVRIGARNDAEENDAFDSAESSPKKSVN